MDSARRKLSDDELFVLSEVQAFWGDQNTEDEVFISDLDEAVLFVKSRDGGSPLVVVLTNLGTWHRDGTLSLEELRQWIQGPAAA